MPDARMPLGSIEVTSSVGQYRVDFSDDFTKELAQLAADGTAYFVVDTGVLEKHGERLASVIPAGRRIDLEPDEGLKTLGGAEHLVLHLSDAAVRRGNRLVAIGGGVIQDVASFTASILYRGTPWVYFPTTLLGQADSCIGGKTSINVGDRKNLVGTFHPAERIVVDPGFLESLPEVEVRSGIGEIFHYYIYADSPLTRALSEDYVELLADRRRLGQHIREALRIKRDVIQVDEFDRGERNKFNYGHTFGHALESITGFELRHGQAVTVGMCLANRLSVAVGLTDDATADAVNRLLAVNLPDFDGTDLDLGRYLELLSRDKKNRDAESLTCILLEGPGRLVKHSLPIDAELRARIARFFAEELPPLLELRR